MGHQEEFAGGLRPRLTTAGRMQVQVSKVSVLLVLPDPAEGVGGGSLLTIAYWIISGHLTLAEPIRYASSRI